MNGVLPCLFPFLHEMLEGRGDQKGCVSVTAMTLSLLNGNTTAASKGAAKTHSSNTKKSYFTVVYS
jgi:hypothetical protein